MIVFRKYIVIDRKNCNFAIENNIFDCRKCTFAVFKNLESGSPGLYPLSSLCTSLLIKFTDLNTDLFLFVEFIIICYGAFVFSFFLFLTTCPSGSFYAFLETRRFP